jgi:hypothetical protein
MATLDTDIGRFSLEEAMFLSQPLLEVLAGRGIEDIDAFLKVPSWNDLPDPFSIPSMEKAADRVLCAVRRRERITIFGDYDCDGVLGAHILRSVLSGLGAPARTSLPHRDEGYGLSSSAVHSFSCSGTDLLITVDNGINARAAVRLAQRLGIDVVVIDHHRIQDRAETTAVWSEAFCGAGLAAMFAWALALSAGWNDTKVERLLSGCSQYAAIASIADCVPLLNGTRILARLGLAELSRSRHKGLQELLKTACTDPSRPDSRDVAFGVAPRINAAGRMAHPVEALAVFEAALDEGAARQAVDRLNQLNQERRRTVKIALTGYDKAACWRFLKKHGVERPGSGSRRTFDPTTVESIIEYVSEHGVRAASQRFHCEAKTLYNLIHRRGYSHYGKDLLSLRQICSHFCVRYSKVMSWIEQGLLKAKCEQTRTGRPIYSIEFEALQKFCKEHRNLLITRRWPPQRIRFLEEYVFAPKHAELLRTRESKRENGAFDRGEYIDPDENFQRRA